jgi:transcriptional regulator with XRE-family HTH domain
MLLKELLKSRGIKQKWLATKIGVSEVTISHWVTEKAEPTKENIEKLCKVLNISIHDFTN